MIDSWIVATMIYITFFYPYLLMLYCIKNVNRDIFKSNRIIVNIKSSLQDDVNLFIKNSKKC